jgi:hypothetical protein
MLLALAKLSLICPAVALAFALTACASHATPHPAASSPSQHVDAPERLQTPDTQVQPPFRNRAEIQANIEALEVERAQLQTRYLAPHPEIRDIDRQLDILYAQIKMLE